MFVAEKSIGMDQIKSEELDASPKNGIEELPADDPSARLIELEGIIERSNENFFHVAGSALAEIQAKKLYRPEYRSFASYVKKRFGFSRQHAYRAIDYAKNAKMSPTGDMPTENAYRRDKARKQGALDPKSGRKAKKTSKVIFDLEVEFETFTNLVTRWEKGLSKPDYSVLLHRVDLYLDDILCDGAAEEMAVAA
jgi:hypothetical protein